MQQLGQLIASMNALVFATILAVIAVIFVAVIYFIFAEITGSSSKIENVMSHYNRALSAWCAFAAREELQNAYPVAIEIDADKAPFGIMVKKVVVVAKIGFIETKYRLIRADQNFVHFEREPESE